MATRRTTPPAPAVVDVTPLVESSALPDATPADVDTLLGILQRIADKLGCDLVPRPTDTADHGGEIVVRR